jgi:hypothetical protein
MHEINVYGIILKVSSEAGRIVTLETHFLYRLYTSRDSKKPEACFNYWKDVFGLARPYRTQYLNDSASYSGDPGFKSGLGDWLF